MKHSQLKAARIATARAEIIRYFDHYERCADVANRLANMPDMEAPMDVETAKFINEYLADVPTFEGVKIETSFGPFDSFKNALSTIGRILAYIFRKILELLKWIFDQHYRARKEFIDMRTFIMSINSDRFKSQFEHIYCNTIVLRKDVMELIMKSVRLTDLIKSTVGVVSVEHIDALLISFRSQAGFDLQLMPDGVNDKFVDLTMAFAPANNMTMETAGWTVDALLSALEAQIDLVTKVVDLKQTEKRLRKEAADIEDQIRVAIDKGQTVESVKHLQEEAAFRIRKAKIIFNALSVLNKRTLGISNVLRALTKEAKRFK